MVYIFIPDIANIIISFFDFNKSVDLKTTINFLFSTKTFQNMNNVYNEKFLESVFHLILESKQKYNITTIENILKYIDPSKYSNYAIKIACENNHVEIVKLLLKDSRIKFTYLEKWRSDGDTTIDSSEEDYSSDSYGSSDDENDKCNNDSDSDSDVDDQTFKNHISKEESSSESNRSESESEISDEETTFKVITSEFQNKITKEENEKNIVDHPLILACKNNNCKIIELLLQDSRFNKRKYLKKSIKSVIHNINAVEIYKTIFKEKELLLNYYGPYDFDNFVPKIIEKNNIEIVKVLLTVPHIFTESYICEYAIRSLKNNKYEIFEYLVNEKKIDIKKYLNEIFCRITPITAFNIKIKTRILEFILNNVGIEYFFKNILFGDNINTPVFINFVLDKCSNLPNNNLLFEIAEIIFKKEQYNNLLFFIKHKNTKFSEKQINNLILSYDPYCSVKYARFVKEIIKKYSLPIKKRLATRIIYLCCENKNEYSIAKFLLNPSLIKWKLNLLKKFLVYSNGNFNYKLSFLLMKMINNLKNKT